jgi:hypothetical protein
VLEEISFMVMKFKYPKNLNRNPGICKSVKGRNDTIYIVLMKPQSILSPPPRIKLNTRVMAIAPAAAV